MSSIFNIFMIVFLIFLCGSIKAINLKKSKTNGCPANTYLRQCDNIVLRYDKVEVCCLSWFSICTSTKESFFSPVRTATCSIN